MRRRLREPLLHFLALGAVIFALNWWRQGTRPMATVTPRIEVTAAVIDRLRGGYERQFGQPPDAEALHGLVNAHVREEVLYREALTLGLDRDDTIVRQRLAQKMEFLTGDLAGLARPDEAALSEFFERNAARYARPARVSFRHVYFSREKRGASGEVAAREALAALGRGASDEAMGDAFLHGFEFAEREPQEIGALFGGEFAAALGALREGEWSGPIASSYGLHLVRVDGRGPLRPAGLDAMRETVVRDLDEERRTTANREAFEKLCAGYQVSVDRAALDRAAGAAKEVARR